MGKHSSKILSIAILVPFMILIFFGMYLLMDQLELKPVLQHYFSPDIDEIINTAEDNLEMEAPYKGWMEDIYGLAYRALNINVIGNFEYIMDSRIQYTQTLDQAYFDSVYQGLSDIKSRIPDTPVFYVKMPDRGLDFPARNTFSYLEPICRSWMQCCNP